MASYNSSPTIAPKEWDEDTFHELYKQYYKALASYAYQFVGVDETAEDIVQDVFAILWENKSSYNNLAALKAFLYNTTRNKAIDILRHRHSQKRYMNKAMENGMPFRINPDGEEEFFDEEIYRQLFIAIHELPERQREIFILKMKGKKYKEIAHELDISLSTVKTLRQRAFNTIKKKLNQEAFTLFLLLFA